jgi:hypothetical protein
LLPFQRFLDSTKEATGLRSLRLDFWLFFVTFLFLLIGVRFYGILITRRLRCRHDRHTRPRKTTTFALILTDTATFANFVFSDPVATVVLLDAVKTLPDDY